MKLSRVPFAPAFSWSPFGGWIMLKGASKKWLKFQFDRSYKCLSSRKSPNPRLPQPSAPQKSRPENRRMRDSPGFQRRWQPHRLSQLLCRWFSWPHRGPQPSGSRGYHAPTTVFSSTTISPTISFSKCLPWTGVSGSFAPNQVQLAFKVAPWFAPGPSPANSLHNKRWKQAC